MPKPAIHCLLHPLSFQTFKSNQAHVARSMIRNLRVASCDGWPSAGSGQQQFPFLQETWRTCGMLLSERFGESSGKADERLRRLVHSFLQVGSPIQRHAAVPACLPCWGQQQLPRYHQWPIDGMQACHFWWRQNPRLVRTVVVQLPVRQGYPQRCAPPADLPRRVLVRLPAHIASR